MRINPLVLLALCLPALQAHAADWTPLAAAGAVDQYFYDGSKLVIKDEEITYWKKVLFQQRQNIKGREVVSGLLRERIHCGEHTAKLVSYLYYSAAGDTVEYVPRDDSEPMPIIPDTVGDAFERALCPKVWQKQEEARIKAEQKAAAAELAAARQQAAKPEGPQGAPAVPAVKPPLPPSVNLPAVNPPQAVRPPATAIIQKAPDKSRVVIPQPQGQLPMPQIVPELPMPQPTDQLY